jgi:hypothetical protein
MSESPETPFSMRFNAATGCVVHAVIMAAARSSDLIAIVGGKNVCGPRVYANQSTQLDEMKARKKKEERVPGLAVSMAMRYAQVSCSDIAIHTVQWQDRSILQ